MAASRIIRIITTGDTCLEESMFRTCKKNLKIFFNDGASQGLLARKRLSELLELQQGGAGLQRFLTRPEAETPLDRVPPSLLDGNYIPSSLSPTLDQNWRVWSWTSVPLAVATGDPW